MNIAAMEARETKRIYISGKISNLPQDEVEDKFKSAEKVLTSAGYEVINPLSLPHDHERTWQSFMKEDLKALLSCDIIWMLPCWKDSKGACIERDLALKLGIEVRYAGGES